MAPRDLLAERDIDLDESSNYSLSPNELIRFNRVDTVADPFQHFVVQQVFAPALADALLRWLETCDHWCLAEQQLYQQYEFEFAAKSFPMMIAPIARSDVLARLVSLCEFHFGEPLFSGLSITAHKLVAGQYIGVHTDAPSPQYGMETHRLVVQLNRGEGSVLGGSLQLFRERSAPIPSGSYRPRHNAGLGFAFTQRSYHAVAPVEGGERYSVIFTFRRANGREDEEIMNELPPMYQERLFFADARPTAE